MEPSNPEESSGTSEQPTKTVGIEWVIVGIVAFVFVGYLIANGGLGDSDDKADTGNKYAAINMCEDFIKDRLKSPSSAKFDLDTSGSGPSYTVTGSVDADNSFGASVRYNVTCKVTLRDGKATLDSLTGLN